jgi:uncharacterized protein (TIRG00374 family)
MFFLYLLLSNNQRIVRVVLSTVKKVKPEFESNVRRFFESIREGLFVLKKSTHYLQITFISIVLWILYLGITWIVLQAMELNPGVAEAAVLLTLTTIVISIPSAPGYVGTYHAAAIFALGLFQIPQDTARATAVVSHAVGWIPLLIIGFYYFVRMQIHFTDIKKMEMKAV